MECLKRALRKKASRTAGLVLDSENDWPTSSLSSPAIPANAGQFQIRYPSSPPPPSYSQFAPPYPPSAPTVAPPVPQNGSTFAPFDASPHHIPPLTPAPVTYAVPVTSAPPHNVTAPHGQGQHSVYASTLSFPRSPALPVTTAHYHFASPPPLHLPQEPIFTCQAGPVVDAFRDQLQGGIPGDALDSNGTATSMAGINAPFITPSSGNGGVLDNLPLDAEGVIKQMTAAPGQPAGLPTNNPSTEASAGYMAMKQKDQARVGVEMQRAKYIADVSHEKSRHEYAGDTVIMTREDVEFVRRLEQRQSTMPGPRWYINSAEADLIIKIQGPGGPIATALSGLEDGKTFALSNAARYTEVGDAVLNKIGKGLSRVLDTSQGVQEIFQLRDEVNQSTLKGESTDSICGVNVDAVKESEVPIFVVSYRHCDFDNWWRMSEAQMKELFVILSLLTGRGKVRIWCDRIVPRQISKNSRWEAVGLVPYTIFPVIALGCESTFVGGEADDRLWLEIERHMAFCTMGLITIDGKVRASRQASFTSRAYVSSSIRPRLMKVIGDGASVVTALMFYANFMLRGAYSTTTSSTYNLVEEMREIAMRLVQGESVQDLLSIVKEGAPSYDFAGRDAIVYQRLADSAIQVELLACNPDIGSELRYFLQMRPEGSTEQWWDGIQEFVPDVAIGIGLNLACQDSSYTCLYADDNPEMIVHATLRGPAELHGLLLVKPEGENRKKGKVLSWLSNIKRIKALAPCEELMSTDIGASQSHMRDLRSRLDFVLFFVFARLLLSGKDVHRELQKEEEAHKAAYSCGQLSVTEVPTYHVEVLSGNEIEWR